MIWKYDGYAYFRPSENHLMDNLVSLVNTPQAHLASTPSPARCAFLLPGDCVKPVGLGWLDATGRVTKRI